MFLGPDVTRVVASTPGSGTTAHAVSGLGPAVPVERGINQPAEPNGTSQ